MCSNGSDQEQRQVNGAGTQANHRKNTRSQNRAGWGDRKSPSPVVKLGYRNNAVADRNAILET